MKKNNNNLKNRLKKKESKVWTRNANTTESSEKTKTPGTPKV